MELESWQQDVYDSCDDATQAEIEEYLLAGLTFDEAVMLLDI